ncbi:hypothetical protein [Haloprofundus salilacus]|uniref:hypothetical protein n=1 Tax=Haloprofundus salilacus TaxID=2876190 RepID=UPI001CCEC48B|nr:hypothetical protein [Haloprofundus salilacus]
MVDSDDSSPKDTMRGRVEESRWKLWFLMNANRWVVAGIVAFGIFATLVLLGYAQLAPIRRVISNYNALWWLFSPMVNSVVTGVTLVVTFNQLVLSQELGPLGDQRGRMSGSLDFREDVEAYVDGNIMPPDPASFLETLLDGLQTHANDLGDAVSDERDEEAKENIRDFVESLTNNATAVGEQLNEAQFGTFDVLFAALNFNYSWKIYEARQLEQSYDDLTDETHEALADVIDVLKFFGPAREHFKTLYFQWELVNLSRVLLYAALPALVVTVSMMLYVDPTQFPGRTLGVDNLVWIVSAATTVTLAPFLLLLSYILRIATVAKRTLAIGPFILRETDRTDDISWD